MALDHLRQGIGLRAYAQRDPLNEYKREAFALFEEMLALLRDRVTQVLAHVELEVSLGDDLFQHPEQETTETRQDPAFEGGIPLPADDFREGEEGLALAPVTRRQAAEFVDPDDPGTWGRVPRNKACPCGSGKKYKHCHGKVA